MSAEMVMATLEGRKTQTRRIYKPQTTNVQGKEYPAIKIFKDGSVVIWGYRNPYSKQFARTYAQKCPYGQPGDRLWVRETSFYCIGSQNYVYRADGEFNQQVGGDSLYPHASPGQPPHTGNHWGPR
jgi:hypothetical protein